VSGDIYQVLELFAAQMAAMQIGAVHCALVLKKSFIHFGCIIALWKVANKWAKGNVPVLGSMLLEVSGRVEGLLATPEDALDDARGASLMFLHVFLKVFSVSFDDLATELALKLLSIAFRLILQEEERFVIVQMIFEIGCRSERLLAVFHCALDDSWLSSLVEFHVPLKIWRRCKIFATELAGVQENGVHISPVHM
jgi:hypothetical protein